MTVSCRGQTDYERPKKNVIRWQKQTDGQGTSMTESAQWGRFSEKQWPFCLTLCHRRPILGIHTLTRSLHDTGNGCFCFGKKTKTLFLLKIVSSQAKIRNTFFDQRSPQHPEVGVLRWRRQTDRQTNKQTNKQKQLYYKC